jgi:hypothetical protein
MNEMKLPIRPRCAVWSDGDPIYEYKVVTEYKRLPMKTLEIIFENETKEVECDDIELHDNILHVIVCGKVTQMWNMSKVVGVVLHD